MIQRILIICFLLFFQTLSFAQGKVVNIYAWTGEIPDFVVRQFEKETGIKVNIATYGNNEIMYAKLRATKNAGYDIVMPSSYFVDRMWHQNMLEKLDKSQLSNWKNLNPKFLNPAYDPNTQFSVPYIWGVTGVVLNDKNYSVNQVKKWNDLWSPKYKNQLLLLDDTREIFSVALLTLGYSVNDKDPKHIEEAFLKLKSLMPNVKVFSTETVISIMIDEDAELGIAWNGDTYKASEENKNVKFIYPQEGFVIWVDNLAIPKDAPHKKTAYQFINYLLRPDVAKAIALSTSYPTANLAAQKLLPDHIRKNQTIYPSADTLKRGQFQTDLGDETLTLYEKYWEELKMMG